MKKLLLLSITAFVSAFANAQEGAQLYLDMNPQKVEILPHVYEFYAKEYTQNPDGTLKFVGNKYALTIDKALVDSVVKRLKKSEMVFLHGPFLEPLVQKMCIRDYAAFRAEEEKKARQKVSDAKKTLKEATDSNGKKAAREALKTADAELLIEQQSTVTNLAILQEIVQRKGAGAIYIYNWQPMLMTQPEKQQNNNQNNTPQNNNPGKGSNLNDILNGF